MPPMPRPAMTDIKRDGWIARLPAGLQPYALLARLDRPIGVWLLFWPGAWGILAARAPLGPSLRLLALFLFGAVVMRAAGCVINDAWDRDLDRKVARTAGRPLASGAVSLRAAMVFLALLLLAGLAVLLQLNLRTQVLGVASLGLVALYPLAKRVTWWPQLVMGATFGFGAPMGFAAAGGAFGPAMAALYAGAILWDLGFDTIYGFQDIEDDVLAGIKSTSRRFAHAPRRFIGSCYALAVLAWAGSFWLGGLGLPGLAALALPAVLLARQVRQFDPRDPASCLAAFRANHAAGSAVALACLAGRL